MTELSGSYLLTLVILLPLLGAAALLAVRRPELVRPVTLLATLLDLGAALVLLAGFDRARSGFQFMESIPWIPTFGISYTLGVDGISLTMIVLTALLAPLCVLCSWSVSQRVKEFHIYLLLMQAAMMGVFSALDFVVFYIFWEAMLIPMFLLIAVWGGSNREHASVKFFVYTFFGSVFLLVAIIAVALANGGFSIVTAMHNPVDPALQRLVFIAFTLAFAIKVPMFPVHTWLPWAHTEAPTAGSVFLASILLKMGTYGFLRFSLPMAPQASREFAPLMIGFSLAAIIWGGFVCLVQKDMKRLIAFSSVAHMGYVTLGIFTFTEMGLQGAVLQMINHGVTAGALFLMVGVIYDRTHSRDLMTNAGLATAMPVYAGFLALFSLSGFAFPGTNNFIGELYVLSAVFRQSTALGLVACAGAVLAAAYMLRMLKIILYGRTDQVALPDMNGRELLTVIPLVVLVLWVGFFPSPLVSYLDGAVAQILTLVVGR
jgi:NADH-quinone oxidoreductase subunit M